MLSAMLTRYDRQYLGFGRGKKGEHCKRLLMLKKSVELGRDKEIFLKL